MTDHTFTLLTNDCARFSVVEHECGMQLSAEASSLRLPPGQWPALIRTDLGNGQPFIVQHPELQDGELVCVRYKQQLGYLTFVIWND